MSQSAEALEALLKVDGPEAEAIRARVHRTALWRYLQGRRRPDLRTATLLEELSSGKVRAAGWSDDAAAGAAGK